MTSFAPSGVMTAILPCNNLDASERFYNRLGYTRSVSQWPPPGEPDTYRLLSNGKGGYLHLTNAVEGWLVPGRNPFGLYLYFDDVDALAAEFRNEIMGKTAPEDKPWGMYEFALSDPDETLVRVGWPTRLRQSSYGSGAVIDVALADVCFGANNRHSDPKVRQRDSPERKPTQRGPLNIKPDDRRSCGNQWF